MVKSVLAYSLETSDGDKAAAELLSQIVITDNMFGIIFTHSDQIENGVIKTVTEKLPFECIGAVSYSQSLSGHRTNADNIITVAVLYGDNFTRFYKIAFDEAEISPETKFKEAAKHTLPDTANVMPAVVIVFNSFMPQYVSGSEFVRIASEFFDGEVPVFGMISNDDTTGIKVKSYVTFGTEYSARGFAALAIYDSDLKPVFNCAGIPEDKIIQYESVITSCEHNVVSEIDWKPASEFFFTAKTTDMSPRDLSYLAHPFVSQAHSGEIVLNTMDVLNENTHKLTFVNDVNEGDKVRWGTLDDDGISREARRFITNITADIAPGSLVFIHNCTLRYALSENKHVANLADTRLNCKYLITVSNGEYCPLKHTAGEKWNNLARTATVIAMIL